MLVLILCVVHAAIRREAEPAAAETMTAAQLIAALHLARRISEAERVVPEPEEFEAAMAEASPAATVTPLPTGRGKKD